MPTISVIVPVYKVEPYIRQCVESLLGQTYSNFELILVDDGSPDSCGAICDEYAEKDSRVRVVHQKNAGASAARNAGVKTAAGEYIAFIDSDDIVCEKYLESLYSAALDSDADITICQSESGTKIPATFGKDNEQNGLSVMTGREACFSVYRMDGVIPIPPWGKLYRKHLFNGIEYPVGMICEDDATTPRLCYVSSKVALINDKLYFYRLQPNSVMNQKFSEKRFDGVRAVDICIDYFNKVGDNELVECAKKARLVMQSKIVVQAYKNNAESAIPAQYKMGKVRALMNIYGYANDDVFTWYLTQIYPKLERPYSYFRKIKQIFGIQKQQRKNPA